METSNEKIIDRIRKLLTLANHPNTSVEEAANAAARAQELLFRHKLDSAQIEIETGEVDVEKIGAVNFDGEGRNGTRWKQTVLNALARGFFCRATRFMIGWISRCASKRRGGRVTRLR